MGKCGKCEGELPSDGNYAKCGGCREKYHLTPQCSIAEVTWNAKGGKKKQSWRCSRCRSSTRDEFVLREEETGTESDATEYGEPRWLKEIADLRALITAGQSKQEEWQQTLEVNYELQTQNIKRLENTIERLLKISEEKDKKIDGLERRLYELESKLYENCIEIQGVPESALEKNGKNGRSAAVTALSVLTRYDSTITENDIKKAYRKPRLGDRNKGKAPIIVVELDSRKDRGNFMKEYRDKVNERESDIKIYEYLMQQQKSLLWEARERARREEWKYVWTRAGNILARKSEGEKVVHIKTKSDLDKICKIF